MSLLLDADGTVSGSLMNSTLSPLFKTNKQKQSSGVWIWFSSVQSLSYVPLFGSHGLQHARPPCPSPTPGVYSNSCPLSQWCHPAISFCHPLLLLPSVFSASGSFPISQFSSGGQSIRVSTSASVLPMNTQDWFPLGWTSWTFLQSKGLLRVFSSITVQKHQFFGAQLSL